MADLDRSGVLRFLMGESELAVGKLGRLDLDTVRARCEESRCGRLVRLQHRFSGCVFFYLDIASLRRMPDSRKHEMKLCFA